jgi:hypothetical protein
MTGKYQGWTCHLREDTDYEMDSRKVRRLVFDLWI